MGQEHLHITLHENLKGLFIIEIASWFVIVLCLVLSVYYYYYFRIVSIIYGFIITNLKKTPLLIILFVFIIINMLNEML